MVAEGHVLWTQARVMGVIQTDLITTGSNDGESVLADWEKIPSPIIKDQIAFETGGCVRVGV